MNGRRERAEGRGRGRAGFTLIEMVVVAAVLSILAAAVIPLTNYARKRSKEIELHAALRDMGEIQSELKQLEQAEMNAKVAAASAPKVDPNWKPEPPPRKGPSVEDELRRIKQGGGTSSATGKAPSSKRRKKRKKNSGVDAELEALKRRMAEEKKR